MRSYRHIAGLTLLVVLTLWALAMVVPDFYRVYQPLGSFEFLRQQRRHHHGCPGAVPETTELPRFSSWLACR